MSSAELRQHPVPPRTLNIFSFSGIDTVDSPNSQLPKDPIRNGCAGTPSPSSKALRSEALRIVTYVGWPHTFLQPQAMASAGFFYRGHGDEVQCAFCLVRVNNWEPSDDPMVEHRRFMPVCPFVNDLPVGNVPLSPAALNSGTLLPRSVPPSPALTPTINVGTPSSRSLMQLPSDMTTDTCARYTQEFRPHAQVEQDSRRSVSAQRAEPVSYDNCNLEALRGPLSTLSIQAHQKAKSPSFSTLASRLKTFEDWPIAIAQRPEQLAEAGFFYLRTGDQVQCFSCNKGFRHWEPKDIPWDEHARWSPECSYLLSMKGADFIHEVLAKYTASHDHEMDKSEQQKEESVGTSVDVVGKEPRDVKEMMLCKICYEEPFCMVFLPCGHSMACPSCSAALSNCPLCRKPIQATVRAYFS